ncbi:hypothetical protein AB0420_05830 [Streptomyces caelestis]|uniref:Uncharacterized protein n=1 Tax=Streptomyces heliomycini TaxID=284032 RepID=A0ABV5L571_9ACTN|nr:hypothetical protein [Streptomyces sp. XY152]
MPTIPDRSLEQLVRQAGGALCRAAPVVRTGAEDEVPEERVPGIDGPEVRGGPGAPDAWPAECGGLITGALRDAGPDVKARSRAGVRDAGAAPHLGPAV